MVYHKGFIDSGGHGHLGYGLPSGQSYFVVLRPDGVVGARVHEVDGQALFSEDIFVADTVKRAENNRQKLPKQQRLTASFWGQLPKRR